MSIYIFILLSARLSFAKTSVNILSQSYDRLSFQEVTGNYIDSRYLSIHTVYPVSYTSTGDKVGHDIQFAFQDDKNYWVSKEPNTEEFHSSINITFSEPTVLEAFLFATSYKSSDDKTRHYCGFPTKLKVYIALNDDDDFVLNTMFTGIPIFPLDTAQFVFKTPVTCKRLRLEFVDVTEDIIFSDGNKATNIRFLNFIKYLPYSDLIYGLPSGNYDNSVYTNFHRIPDSQFEPIPSSEYDNYPIKNAFDNNDNSFWIPNELSDGTSNSHIIINFKKTTLFEGFLFKGYHVQEYVFPSIRQFYPGIPTQLNLYVSQNNEEFVLNTKFSGEPKDKKDLYQFILPEKVLCDRIKIEFVDVVEDNKFTNSKRVVVDQITLFQGFENEGQISQAVNGKYTDGDYLKTHIVPQEDFKLTATGGSQENHDITTSVATDEDDTTYWVSKEPNSDTFHNCVIVNFEKNTVIEAVLIDPVYKTNKGKREFSGFPIRLNIYSSLNKDDEFTLRSNFIGMPDDQTTRVQFVLPESINCSKMKLEFVQVTPFNFDNDGSLYAGAARFIFVKKSDYDIIPYHPNTGFSESRIIPPSKFTYESTGDSDSGPVSNLFDEDDSDSSYWESSFKSENGHYASVFVNFTQPLTLDELLLGAYKGNARNYGFPTKLNVYSSSNENEELKLIATFQGKPDSNRIYQFTFREPIVCSRIQLEFLESFDPYSIDTPACLNFLKFIGEIIDFSSGDFLDDFITQHVNQSYPLPGINDTQLVINDLPSDNDYLFIVEKQFYFNNVSFTCPDAMMSAIKSNNSNNVIVKQCKFDSCSVKNSIGNGGAILSLNCVFKCDDSQFNNCKSKENGGGGGIFIAVNEKINDDITIKSCVFTNCSATFGGALYLYSNSLTNRISVLKCIFQSNTLIGATSKDSLSGGSAVFMNAHLSSVVKCKFIKNEGESSLKIDANIDNVPSRFFKELEGSKQTIEIDDCEFDIHSSSKSSISYVHGSKRAVDTVVSNCVFRGKILNGAHHINVDSKSMKNEKTRLDIKSCKFACDKVKSINLNVNELSNSLVVFNLENQVFNYDVENNSDEEKNVRSNSKKLFVAAMSLVAVAVFALVAVIITVKIKKSDDNENNDINDPLNHPLDVNNI